MIYELNHVGIRIRDLDKSLAFYTGPLGGKVVSEAYIPSARTDCVYLQVADGLVELLRPADPPPETTFGLDHIAFMTADLDGEHQRLEAAGFTFSVLPKVAGTGRGRLAFLSDPSGVRVELLERAENFRIPPLTDGPVRSLDHYSVAADDLAASVAFYGGELGLLPLATLTDADEHTTLSYFHLGSDSVELAHTAEHDAEAPRIRHIGLRVDDAAKATTAFRASGVPVEPGYPRATGTGHGQVSAVRDPDGVRLLLLDRGDLRDLPPDVVPTQT